MVYGTFNVLFNFVDIFSRFFMYAHKEYWSVIFFSYVALSGFGI